MIKLTVYRPKGHTIVRTQAYRVKIVAELATTGSDSSSSSTSSEESYEQGGLQDSNIFLVREDGHGFEHFIGVVEPFDLEEYGDTTNPRRTNEIDCWVGSPEIADAMIDAIVSDIRELLSSAFGFQTTVELSGGTV